MAGELQRGKLQLPLPEYMRPYRPTLRPRLISGNAGIGIGNPPAQTLTTSNNSSTTSTTTIERWVSPKLPVSPTTKSGQTTIKRWVSPKLPVSPTTKRGQRQYKGKWDSSPEPGAEMASCSICVGAVPSEQPCRVVVARTRLMRAGRDKGDFVKVRELFTSLKRDGHSPSLHSYSLLLGVLACKGDMKAATSLLLQMQEEDGMEPDAVCYNTLLNGWCSLGRLGEARALLEAMKKAKCRPTVITYNTLIKGFGAAGRPAEAMRLLQEMVAEGLRPGVRTYNMLINAWVVNNVEKKNVEQACRVLDMMRGAGVTPDVVSFNILVKAYGESGQTREAERIMDEMRNLYYVRPNERTFGILINSYCKFGRPLEGLALVERMRDDGIPYNLPIFNILLKGFAELYQSSNVEKVLQLMEANDVKPDVQSFSLVMNAWSSAGLVKEASAVLDKMRSAKLKPDVFVYSILAKGYVRSQRPAEAEALLEQMILEGQRPNVYSYTTVISGWCNCARMEDALRVFELMQSRGVQPTLNTFHTLIWGFSQAGQPHRADEILGVMQKLGISPDRKCLELVGAAWKAVGLPAIPQLKEAQQLHTLRAAPDREERFPSPDEQFQYDPTYHSSSSKSSSNSSAVSGSILTHFNMPSRSCPYFLPQTTVAGADAGHKYGSFCVHSSRSKGLGESPSGPFPGGVSSKFPRRYFFSSSFVSPCSRLDRNGRHEFKAQDPQGASRCFVTWVSGRGGRVCFVGLGFKPVVASIRTPFTISPIVF